MSVPLANKFARVIATDASAEQIANATPHVRVEYRQALAEKSALPDASVDLVVAAQAAHWFDLTAFYSEVRRVARPAAVIALISYDWMEVNAAIDPLVRRFYSDIARYWPPERRLVEEGYASLPFPFKKIDAPSFIMRAEWNADQLLGYIDTWSAVRKLEAVEGTDRIEAFTRAVRQAWQDETRVRSVRWRLSMRVGRLE